jgi:hypothetical protein
VFCVDPLRRFLSQSPGRVWTEECRRVFSVVLRGVPRLVARNSLPPPLPPLSARLYRHAWHGMILPVCSLMMVGSAAGIVDNIRYSDCGGPTATFPQMTIFDSMYVNNESFAFYLNSTCGVHGNPACSGLDPNDPNAGSTIFRPDVAMDGVARYKEYVTRVLSLSHVLCFGPATSMLTLFWGVVGTSSRWSSFTQTQQRERCQHCRGCCLPCKRATIPATTVWFHRAVDAHSCTVYPGSCNSCTNLRVPVHQSCGCSCQGRAVTEGCLRSPAQRTGLVQDAVLCHVRRSVLPVAPLFRCLVVITHTLRLTTDNWGVFCIPQTPERFTTTSCLRSKTSRTTTHRAISAISARRPETNSTFVGSASAPRPC